MKTLAQIAYEAYCNSLDASLPKPRISVFLKWDELSPEYQAAWRAAIRAAEEAIEQVNYTTFFI